MLDTKSLMQSAACCTMFNKCAMDRFCYVHVDLTTCTRQVDRKVVCTMIDRAGEELRWEFFFFFSSNQLCNLLYITWDHFFFFFAFCIIAYRLLKLGSLARPNWSDSTPSWVDGPFLSTHSYNHKFIWYGFFQHWSNHLLHHRMISISVTYDD